MHHKYKRYWELSRGSQSSFPGMDKEPGHSGKTEDQAAEKMSIATSSIWGGRVLRLGVQ